MNQQINEFEINDIYYADCIQNISFTPQWSTVRINQELTDEASLYKLKEQLSTIVRHKKLPYTFRGKTEVKQILQNIRALPSDLGGRETFLNYGDVLASKYLKTPYSRTRLFMVLRVIHNNVKIVFTLIADLKDEIIYQINRKSLNFITQDIRNSYGDLKKGSMYPAFIDGKFDENRIFLYDERETKHYPESLECVSRLSPEKEAYALVKVLSESCELNRDQVEMAIIELRKNESQHFGRDELLKALNKLGIQVHHERIETAWRKNFNYDHYKISPSVLSLESVQLKFKLDEFEISCPLNYFPDRLNERNEGGFHYLTLRGQEYSELRIGSSVISFA